jgi:hypothetical protein
MSNSAKSIFAFGVYAMANGISLLFFPALLMGILGMPPTTESWHKVVGVLATVLGMYYIAAALQNNIGFFKMTVWGRPLFFLGMVGIVLFYNGGAGLLLSGAIDLVTAGITAYLLRQEAA